MTVTANKYVTIAYDFSTPEGYLLGTSDRQGPLTFCAGSGDILPGLDKNLQGKPVGEKQTFVLPAAEAYGERDESLVTTVKVSDLGLSVPPKVGYRVEAQIDGRWRTALVSELEGDNATLDANHPLAGVDLHFNCTILSIDDEPPVQSCGCGSGGCGCGSESAEGESCSSGGCGCGSGGCGCS
ncbi:MAG: hypothetical protein HKM06_05345 [Spirochaetales bacterium]|nr:hypothetical protein [Spirochaetales bacterium]